MYKRQGKNGFTLIEISIVLVIIGLLVGGVLVGRNLIYSAEIRAQITQIEKFQQAVNTFKAKYNALPGDMDGATATQFGFTPRGQYAGEGDGNGILEGVFSNAAGQNKGELQGIGESTMFWVDLTTANGLNVNLIDGAFNTARPDSALVSFPVTSGIDKWLPRGKIGTDSFILVWSQNSANYFCLQTVWWVGAAINGASQLTARQAYSIDAKIDDGLPQTGNVIAMFLRSSPAYATGAPYPAGGASDTSPTPGSALTCYDNGNVNGAVQQYSLTQNNGAGTNCALSFKFQ